MPEIDRNYLAGLYLDEITLDVMPQEYIDAALEVKLRHDACAPRAGYNCVQDRRVKGGFYYRKAPQGQGVNALPPSKLERAMARSQEQSTPRSGMSFLSKAAIGAGLAIGGLALTGAVVNAGRSSEPYQEPIRQRSGNTQPNNNAVKVVAATAATAAAGLGVKSLLDKDKPQPQPQTQTITPQESAKTPEPPKPVKTPEEEEGYKEQQRRNQAIAELTRVGYDTQKKAYEQALSKDLEKAGVTPEGIEQKKKNLQFDDDNEGFVRIDQVKENTADGVQLTKAARAKQSDDLQALYDKLKENGVEDAIEFRTARSRSRVNAGSELTAPTSNPYTIIIDGEKKSMGEMRFRKNKDQIVGAIAERIKSKDTPQSQPSTVPSKPAVPRGEVRVPKPLDNPASSEANTRALKDRASGTLAEAIRSSSPTPDGYVNQASLLNDPVLKKELSGNDPADLIAEGIAEGRMQRKKAGKSTYIRDLSAIPFESLAAEAKSLDNVTDLKRDPRVKDLNDALNYKERKATNDDERLGVANLRDAIASIQEVKPSDRGNKKPPEPKPDNEGGEGGGKKVRGESAKMKTAADKAKNQGTPDADPPVVGRSQEQIAADRLAEEQVKTAKKQEADQSKKEGMSRLAQGRLTEKASELSIKKQQKQIDGDEFNAEVEKLRQSPVTTRAVENAIAPIRNEYDDRIAETSSEVKRKSLEKEKAIKIEEQTLETYKDLQIPDFVQVKPPVKEASAPEPSKVAPVPSASVAPPVATESSQPVNTASSTANQKPLDKSDPSYVALSKVKNEDLKKMLSDMGIPIPKGTSKKDDLIALIAAGKTNNDAIATSESYLSAYEETRNKYRRSS